MKITILVEKAHPLELRAMGDAIWAAQKDNHALAWDVREAMKAMSTSLHAEAAKLEKK